MIIKAAQVTQELNEQAKEMRKASAPGEKLGLNDDELASYDALETNDSAVQVLGDETLRTIAQELVETVRRNATIDWTVREIGSVDSMLDTPSSALLGRSESGPGMVPFKPGRSSYDLP